MIIDIDEWVKAAIDLDSEKFDTLIRETSKPDTFNLTPSRSLDDRIAALTSLAGFNLDQGELSLCASLAAVGIHVCDHGITVHRSVEKKNELAEHLANFALIGKQAHAKMQRPVRQLKLLEEALESLKGLEGQTPVVNLRFERIASLIETGRYDNALTELVKERKAGHRNHPDYRRCSEELIYQKTDFKWVDGQWQPHRKEHDPDAESLETLLTTLLPELCCEGIDGLDEPCAPAAETAFDQDEAPSPRAPAARPEPAPETKQATADATETDSEAVSESIDSHMIAPKWYQILQTEIDRLQVGQIAFNPPETMRLGVTERIETRISRDPTANLTHALKGSGTARVEDLKISELMKVRLSGEDFTIAALNEEEQFIADSGHTEWAWDVTPDKSGRKTLHLHVTLRIRLPHGEEKKDHPVLNRQIQVSVNPGYSLKRFAAAYWKWIITALILPLIGWLWKRYIN